MVQAIYILFITIDNNMSSFASVKNLKNVLIYLL